MTTLTEAPATVTRIDADACPPWCENDHEDGDTSHYAGELVELSALPYEVNGEQYREGIWVSREQAAGTAPVVLLDMPVTETPEPARLTLGEAAGLAAALYRAVTANSTRS